LMKRKLHRRKDLYKTGFEVEHIDIIYNDKV